MRAQEEEESIKAWARDGDGDRSPLDRREGGGETIIEATFKNIAWNRGRLTCGSGDWASRKWRTTIPYEHCHCCYSSSIVRNAIPFGKRATTETRACRNTGACKPLCSYLSFCTPQHFFSLNSSFLYLCLHLFLFLSPGLMVKFYLPKFPPFLFIPFVYIGK